jgi:choline dehydrogenase-like flavoprotein
LVKIGNPGWGFEELSPYFKKAQSHTPQENQILPGTGIATAYEGLSGPIKVFSFDSVVIVTCMSQIISQTSYNTWYSSLITPFIKSISELSFKINPSPNSGDVTGIINCQRAVDIETSTRQHSGVTYLHQTAGRKNIFVLVGAHATKLHLYETNGDLIVTAVDFYVDGIKHVVKATKEVILAAGMCLTIDTLISISMPFNIQGAIKTPQLLELSGIGRRTILSRYGIQTHVDLPVGENLQDHLMISLNFSLTSEAAGKV